jgi:hypothetical protein
VVSKILQRLALILTSISSSCGLELHYVEPDAIPYEPRDVTIGMSPDTYRDYRLTSSSTELRRSNKEQPNLITQSSTPPEVTSNADCEYYSVDLVCRRLTIKWEPIFNVVHRYLHCRCVARLSTPSQLHDEMTLFVLAPCPRHNNFGINYLDYGNIDYHQDRYFDKFGGYDCFRALVYLERNIYKMLGGERFLPIEDAVCTLEALEQDDDALGFFRESYREYFLEINEELRKRGVDLPNEILQRLNDEQLRRKKEGCGEFDPIFGGNRDYGPRIDISSSPLIQELHQILDGEWSGTPHWSLDL